MTVSLAWFTRLWGDGACGAVNGDDLPVAQTAGGVAGADDGWDAVFARHQGGVRG
jgi:hypothetical protein